MKEQYIYISKHEDMIKMGGGVPSFMVPNIQHSAVLNICKVVV